MTPNKFESFGQSHLVMATATILPRQEWIPHFSGWCVIRVNAGSGFWVQPRLNRELPNGSVLVVAQAQSGNVRASQLGEMSLAFYQVSPERLVGLASISEMKSLAAAALNPESNVRIFPPDAAISIHLKNFSNADEAGIGSRLKLLSFFVGSLENELEQKTTGESIQATTRLKHFLARTSPLELMDMSLSDLARATGCTPRHLSRIFGEVAGKSFRAEQAEIRLRRALDLLTTTNLKVVDVALESGYSSLSLFNLMFKRRYGASPGKWREKSPEMHHRFRAILNRRSPAKNHQLVKSP